MLRITPAIAANVSDRVWTIKEPLNVGAGLKFTAMATLEEVKAAEERMNTAKAALLDYAKRPATQGRDADLQHRLSEELTRSTKEFLHLISELRP